MLICNKKGGLNELVFILLTMAISGLVIFSFLTSSNVEAKINGALIVNEVNAHESILNFYVGYFGERAFVKTYLSFINNEEYLGGTVKFREGVPVFGNLGFNLDELFLKEFRNNFVSEFQNVMFDKEYVNGFKEKILNGEFEIEAVEDGFEINVGEIKLNSFVEGMNVDYIFDLKQFVNWDFVELDSFDEIEDFVLLCRSKGSLNDVENCFESNQDRLNSFNVVLEKNVESDYVKVSLISDRRFLVGDDLKRIQVDFLVEPLNAVL